MNSKELGFRPISIEDRPVFDRYLQGREYRLITYTFTSFYLWRDWDAYSWRIIDDALCLISSYEDTRDALFPITADNERAFSAIEKLIALYKQAEEPFYLNEIDEDMLHLIEQRWPGRFEVIEQDHGDNYVYRRADLAFLRGKAYDSKRNFRHRFLRSYPQAILLPMSDSLLPSCIELLDKWLAVHDDKHPIDSDEVHFEYRCLRDAMEHFNDLGWIGAALLVDGKVVAFELGEKLNSDTMAIHIEKADTDYIGSFPSINQMFVQRYAQGFSYINRAEDMGDPGLRKAKQSYHPCTMAKKYRLRLR